MEVTLLSRSRMLKGKVETDHYWYDQLNKIMFHGRGGRLEYTYDPVTKRSVPSVVDHEAEMWQSDYPIIQEWVANKQTEFGFEVESDTGKNIVLSVDALRFEAMARDLFEHKILADYDAKELHREIKTSEGRYGKLDSHNRRRLR